MNACQLTSIPVFFPPILPLVLPSACLDAGRGVKSMSNHSQSWAKSCCSVRLSRRNNASLPCRSWMTCSSPNASSVRLNVDCSAKHSRPQAQAKAISGRMRVLTWKMARQPARMLTSTSSTFVLGSLSLSAAQAPQTPERESQCVLGNNPTPPRERNWYPVAC
jgi:hypothetical protein